MDLLIFRDETQEARLSADAERVYQTFEPSAIVARARYLEFCLGYVESGKCFDDDVDAFVLLESTQIDEHRHVGSFCRVWRQPLRIDPIIDHANGCAWDTTGRQIVGGAHADRLERDVAIQRRQR